MTKTSSRSKRERTKVLPPDPEYDTGRGPYVLLALLILIGIVGAFLKFSAPQ